MDTPAYNELRKLFCAITGKYRVSHITAYMFVTAMEAIVPLAPDYAKQHALITIQQMENRIGEKEFLELVKYLMGQCWTTSEEVRKAAAIEIRRIELTSPWAAVPSSSTEEEVDPTEMRRRTTSTGLSNTIPSFSVNQELQQAVSDRDMVIGEQRRKIAELEEQARANVMTLHTTRGASDGGGLTSPLPPHENVGEETDTPRKSKKRRSTKNKAADPEPEGEDRNDGDALRVVQHNRCVPHYENEGDDGGGGPIGQPILMMSNREEDEQPHVRSSHIDGKYEDATRRMRQVEGSALFQHAVAQAAMVTSDESMFAPPLSSGRSPAVGTASRANVISEARKLAIASRVYERVGVTPPRTAPAFSLPEGRPPGGYHHSSPTSAGDRAATIVNQTPTAAAGGEEYTDSSSLRDGRDMENRQTMFHTASGYGMHLRKPVAVAASPVPSINAQSSPFQQQIQQQGHVLQVLPDPQRALPHEYGSKMVYYPTEGRLQMPIAAGGHTPLPTHTNPVASRASPPPPTSTPLVSYTTTPTDTLLPSASMLTAEDVHRILTTPPSSSRPATAAVPSPSAQMMRSTRTTHERMDSVYHLFQLERSRTASSFAKNKPFNDGFLASGQEKTS